MASYPEDWTDLGATQLVGFKQDLGGMCIFPSAAATSFYLWFIFM